MSCPHCDYTEIREHCPSTGCDWQICARCHAYINSIGLHTHSEHGKPDDTCKHPPQQRVR